MAVAVLNSRDPTKVAAGRMGGRARWGPQRVVRLDSLDPAIREAVNALLRLDQARRTERTTQEPEAA